MKALLDTNFLLIPAQFRVDIFSELQAFGNPDLYTLDLVLRELEKLAASSRKASSHARVALQLVKQEGVRILFARSRSTDAEIVRIAREKGLAVCTQDRALIRRLKARKIPVITLRQRRYLMKQ